MELAAVMGGRVLEAWPAAVVLRCAPEAEAWEVVRFFLDALEKSRGRALHLTHLHETAAGLVLNRVEFGT